MELSQLWTDLLPTTGPLLIIRAILASVLLFLLPGLAWSLVIFKKVDIIERFVISIVLSIALVTLCIFASNLVFGIRVNGMNAIWITLVIIAIPLAIYFVRRFRARHADIIDGD